MTGRLLVVALVVIMMVGYFLTRGSADAPEKASRAAPEKQSAKTPRSTVEQRRIFAPKNPDGEPSGRPASARPPAPIKRVDVRLERDVISEAKRKLRAGDTASAIALLGSLVGDDALGRHHEDAMALYIEALVKGGKRDQAHAQLNTFKARYPKSRYLLKNGSLKTR